MCYPRISRGVRGGLDGAGAPARGVKCLDWWGWAGANRCLGEPYRKWPTSSSALTARAIYASNQRGLGVRRELVGLRDKSCSAQGIIRRFTKR